MAKGRKLTSSRSERMLGEYEYGHSYEFSADAPDLGEEEVWSMVNGDDRSVNGSQGEWNQRGNIRGTFPKISNDGKDHVGGLSLAFEEPAGRTTPSMILHQFRGQDAAAAGCPRGPQLGRLVATSAPVNVPDWSKIYRVDSVESMRDSDDGGDDADLEMVPPHEYLAREYARSRKTSQNSVFEGMGRTLKGRDMTRVRDAVWSQTGFDG